MRIKEYIKVDWNKFLHFLKKFSKEIIIALILAVVAAVWLEKYNEDVGTKILQNNLKAVAMISGEDSDGNEITGSGLFINSNGLLITNAHVIKEIKSNIRAKISTGAYYFADENSIKVEDKDLDIAMIQFDAKETPSVNLGDSDKIIVGEKVLAIGSPLGMEGNVTEGIISFVNRELDKGQKFIQFTAPISNGNSGGGLFDKDGKVIGITTRSITIPPELQKDIDAQNLNFAIPINDFKKAQTGDNAGTRFNNNNPDYFYSLGILAKNNKDYDAAIENFNKAITLDEQYGEAYVELGNVYYLKGNYGSEVEVLRKAIKLITDNPDVYSSLAAAYEDTKQYDAAIENYKKALSLSPKDKDKDTIYALGNLYLVKGDKEGAKKTISEIAPLDAGLADELERIIEQMK